MNFNFKNWNWKHTLALVASMLVGAGAAFGSAVLQYLQTQPTATLFAALASTDALKPLILGALSAGLMAIVSLVQHSFSSTTPAPANGNGTAPKPPIPPIVACMSLVALVMAFVGCLSASTQNTIKSVTDTAGSVCQVVFLSVDPSLAPLCTTAQDVAKAIEALIAQATDGGSTGAANPSQADVYAWLAAHGARTVASVTTK